VICFLFLVFFFHAVGGLRDRNVTGVQTCALPILPISAVVRSFGPCSACAERSARTASSTRRDCSASPKWSSSSATDNTVAVGSRSEERRVGGKWKVGGAGRVRLRTI